MKNDIDILRKVEDSELKSVLAALREDWPTHFLLYQHVTIMREYKHSNVKNPEQNLYIYGTYEDGFYVMEVKYLSPEGPLTSYFIYSPANDLSDLPSVLSRTHHIPWQDGDTKFCFEITVQRFSPAVREAAQAHGVKVINEVATYLSWLPPDQPFDYGELPEGVFLEYLKETDAPKINQTWARKAPGTEEFLATQIRNNFGLGLYRKSDKVLLSHSISFHCGGIYVLGTDAEERNKGYAEIVVRNMVRELRKRGRIPFCTVHCLNVPSQKLFRKIGFQEYSKADFIFF